MGGQLPFPIFWMVLSAALLILMMTGAGPKVRLTYPPNPNHSGEPHFGGGGDRCRESFITFAQSQTRRG